MENCINQQIKTIRKHTAPFICQWLQSQKLLNNGDVARKLF